MLLSLIQSLNFILFSFSNKIKSYFDFTFWASEGF
jgi:hypothetical protein